MNISFVAIQDGASWSLDPCTQCSCAQSEVHCSVQQCPVYRAKEHHRHAGGKSHRMGKSSSSAGLLHGLSGSKVSGGVKGNNNNVQPAGGSQPCPPGRHPVKEPGQCCPKCVEGKRQISSNRILTLDGGRRRRPAIRALLTVLEQTLRRLPSKSHRGRT